jgi:hypothetical protein
LQRSKISVISLSGCSRGHTEPDAVPDFGVHSRPDPHTHPRADLYADAHPDVYSHAHPDINSHAHPDVYSHAHPELHAHTCAHVHVDASSDVHTHASSVLHTHSRPNTHTYNVCAHCARRHSCAHLHSDGCSHTNADGTANACSCPNVHGVPLSGAVADSVDTAVIRLHSLADRQPNNAIAQTDSFAIADGYCEYCTFALAGDNKRA